jgi:spermidine synthase
MKPLSYYGQESGVGQALKHVSQLTNVHVGVVGMGTATVAAYGGKSHRFRFYEIDPDIVTIAREYFTYLSDFESRSGQVEVVLGDARLSLERELTNGQNQQFDVLLLDAFAGDSVPVHLLTREAFEIYQRHMKPDGIIAVHVSNTYLALAPMVERTAESIGYQTSILSAPTDDPIEATDYVLVSHNTSFLLGLPEFPAKFDDPKYLKFKLWTDQQHNLMEILE